MRLYLYIFAFFSCISIFSCQTKTTDSTKAPLTEVDSAELRRKEAKIRKDIKADVKAALIEEVIQKKLAQGFNGNVLIAQKDVIVYEKAFGYASFKDTVRNVLQSKFQLASLSKTF
ncbi:MAG TPA: serine hydrolase, partial [Emticicia sp.]